MPEARSTGSFGIDTVTFVSFVESGTPGALGTYAVTEQTVDAPNCRHRPLTFKETAELDTDIATELWKTTVPIGSYSETLRAAVMAARNTGVIRVDGVDYQIIGGVRPHDDMDIGPFKMTILSQRQIG